MIRYLDLLFNIKPYKKILTSLLFNHNTVLSFMNNLKTAILLCEMAELLHGFFFMIGIVCSTVVHKCSPFVNLSVLGNVLSSPQAIKFHRLAQLKFLRL